MSSKRGFKVLAELSSANIPFASSGLVVPQTYLKKEPDVVENVLKALIEATAFLYKPANAGRARNLNRSPQAVRHGIGQRGAAGFGQAGGKKALS